LSKYQSFAIEKNNVTKAKTLPLTHPLETHGPTSPNNTSTPPTINSDCSLMTFHKILAPTPPFSYTADPLSNKYR
jgi:hypothetical protein